MRTIRTLEGEKAFLEALAQSGNVSEACDAAGIGRTAAYAWRNDDPEFEKAWEAALVLGIDALEDEALRRAHRGTEKPVFYLGEQCGTIREYSDTLMMFMLKGRRPEKFKDRGSVEHSGKLTLEGLVAASMAIASE
jgi:hypothetical protein